MNIVEVVDLLVSFLESQGYQYVETYERFEKLTNITNRFGDKCEANNYPDEYPCMIKLADDAGVIRPLCNGDLEEHFYHIVLLDDTTINNYLSMG